MDLSFLDKSSQVTPLLVRLYDEHKLYKMGKGDRVDSRTQLAGVVSSLLHAVVTPRESDLIADVLIEMMRQAEMDLRQALAERLSSMHNVPLRLVLQLANDDISIADTVLRNSPVLGDLDLVYIIKSQSPAYWRAIARRHGLSDNVVDVLVDTRDLDTAIALAENSSIHLSEHAALVMSDIAQGSEKLARPLLRRDDVPDHVAASLYRYVGEELKRYISQHYSLPGNVMVVTATEIIDEFSTIAGADEFMPTAAQVSAADTFRQRGVLTMGFMLGTLRRGQIGSFIAQFSSFMGLEPKVVLEVLTQKSGQGLAVCCKAHSIAKPDFVSLFLLTNRIRMEGKMVDMQDMTRAVNYFDRIDMDVARDIIKNSIKDFSNRH